MLTQDGHLVEVDEGSYKNQQEKKLITKKFIR